MNIELKTRLVEKAIDIRVVEEKLLNLFDSGKLYGTVHTTIGQEFSAVCVIDHLLYEDIVVSNHRCHGHFIAKTEKIHELIAELMGRVSGICHGIGGSQHLCDTNFFSNGIQGGILPLAAGLALAAKERGDNVIVTVFVGDGTFGEGALYEAFNIISKWKLPVLIVVEDNKYSQSTSQSQTLAGSIKGRAEGFGIEYKYGNTWEWEALHNTARHAVRRVREDSNPILLHIETYRLAAHSKGDDLRDNAEICQYRDLDPLNKLVSDEYNYKYIAAQKKIEDIVSKINNEDFSNLSISRIHRERESLEIALYVQEEKALYGNLINTCLHEILFSSAETYVFGEDIEDPYGGAFKITKGLSTQYPNQVKNFPISEACLVGLGAGFSLSTGYRAITEIMFGDFMTLALDQVLNHAAKYEQMYGGKVKSSITIRVPMGGGRGYGPTHSQTLDKHFLGIPGLTVYALNPCLHPKEIYSSSLSDESGLIIENKILYGMPLITHVEDGFDIYVLKSINSVDILVKPESDKIDVTIITYGGMTKPAIDACAELFMKHDIIAQCLVIGRIYPLDITKYNELYCDVNTVLVVEEGQGFAGFGSEIIAQISEDMAFNGQYRRLYAEPICIPSAKMLESIVLPTKEKIIDLCIQAGK